MDCSAGYILNVLLFEPPADIFPLICERRDDSDLLILIFPDIFKNTFRLLGRGIFIIRPVIGDIYADKGRFRIFLILNDQFIVVIFFVVK